MQDHHRWVRDRSLRPRTQAPPCFDHGGISPSQTRPVSAPRLRLRQAAYHFCRCAGFADVTLMLSRRNAARCSRVAFLAVALTLGVANAADTPFDEPALYEVIYGSTNPTLPRVNSPEVLTQRNNNLRTGAVRRPGFDQDAFAAGRFGFLGSIPAAGSVLDGAVLAQPLFMHTVRFPGGDNSAVFIATSSNKIYAFESEPPFRQHWMTDLGPPFATIDPWNPSNPFHKSCPELMTTTEQESGSTHRFVIGIE